jgi:hypothetical protein
VISLQQMLLRFMTRSKGRKMAYPLFNGGCLLIRRGDSCTNVIRVSVRHRSNLLPFFGSWQGSEKVKMYLLIGCQRVETSWVQS